MVLKILGAVMSGGMLVIAVVGVCYGVKQWKAARKQRKREFLSEYLREYRSVEMGQAIAELWDFYRHNDGDTRRMSDSYFTQYQDDPERRFHFKVRRRVSAFYQEMAFLAERDKDVQEILYQVWIEGDLRIIRDVLLPLELEAVPRVVGPVPKKENEKISVNEEWSPAIKAMAKLYNGAFEREEKEKQRNKRKPS
jgi:hypothetical protein